MNQTVVTDHGAEIEDGRTLSTVGQRRQRVLEETLERHALGGPGVRADVLEPPLHDELREAGARDVVQIELPRRRERRAQRLVVDGGHDLLSSRPQVVGSLPRGRERKRECGRVESNHHSARRRVYRPLSSPSAQRPREGVADRGRTGAARITTADAAVTPRPPWSGDDRTRTGGLSPDKRALIL